MQNLSYVERVAYWKKFRLSLETEPEAILSTIHFWKNIPEVGIQADPYDQSSWPDPWEMIEENIYCPFVKILAICYTLQLTDRFSEACFEINIVQDKKNSETKYLLNINGLCVGYDYSNPISIATLPNSLVIEKSYTMPSLQ